MCLGVPGRIVEIFRDEDVRMAKVDFGGVTKRVCLEHVNDAREGDWVIVHVGFALSRVDEAEAQRIFDMLAELGQLTEELA